MVGILFYLFSVNNLDVMAVMVQQCAISADGNLVSLTEDIINCPMLKAEMLPQVICWLYHYMMFHYRRVVFFDVDSTVGGCAG